MEGLITTVQLACRLDRWRTHREADRESPPPDPRQHWGEYLVWLAEVCPEPVGQGRQQRKARLDAARIQASRWGLAPVPGVWGEPGQRMWDAAAVEAAVAQARGRGNRVPRRAKGAARP